MRLATVTLNGTLDRVIHVPRFRPGEIRDVDRALILAGGKGIHVARSAAALGADVLAAGIVAGKCGEWIAALLDQEAIAHYLVRLPDGESRISTIVVDAEQRQTTVVNDLGPSVAPEAWPAIRARLVRAVLDRPWVALAGASLPGLPDAAYADLCAEIQGAGQHVCLDTRDRWLAAGLAARPALVKCNQHEAAQLLGHPVDTPIQARAAARAWIDQGLSQVVITLGQGGAVAVDRERAWHVVAPRVDALYPIGSGDAMTGGLIVAMQEDRPFAQAVRFGVAVGAANTLLPGSGRCALDVLPDLLTRTEVRPL